MKRDRPTFTFLGTVLYLIFWRYFGGTPVVFLIRNTTNTYLQKLEPVNMYVLYKYIKSKYTLNSKLGNEVGKLPLEKGKIII